MYKTIYTTLGLALVSQAVSQQKTIEIAHFAMGVSGRFYVDTWSDPATLLP